MSSLPRVLPKLLNRLERYLPEMADSLHPGLTREAIDEMFDSLPFSLPEELYEIYKWRNGGAGAQLEGPYQVFGIEFVSLEENLVFIEEQLKQTGCGLYYFILFRCRSPDDEYYFGIPLNYNSCPVIYWTATQHMHRMHQVKREDIKKRIFYPAIGNIFYAILEWSECSIRRTTTKSDKPWFYVMPNNLSGYIESTATRR